MSKEERETMAMMTLIDVGDYDGFYEDIPECSDAVLILLANNAGLKKRYPYEHKMVLAEQDNRA